MKSRVVTLTILLTTIGLAVPVTAQIRRPSQDFFEQGRERVEREIRILQGSPTELGENPEGANSEPLLEISPSPEISPTQQPNEVETPNQKPDEADPRPAWPK